MLVVRQAYIQTSRVMYRQAGTYLNIIHVAGRNIDRQAYIQTSRFMDRHAGKYYSCSRPKYWQTGLFIQTSRFMDRHAGKYYSCSRLKYRPTGLYVRTSRFMYRQADINCSWKQADRLIPILAGMPIFNQAGGHEQTIWQRLFTWQAEIQA